MLGLVRYLCQENQSILNFKNHTKQLEDVTTCLDLLDTFVKKIKVKWSERSYKYKECKILRGPPGKPGRRGHRGKRGPKGEPGHKGSIGKHGPPGPRGEKGFSGNVTVIGLKGDMGPKGTKGDKGNIGKKGQRGADGPKGNFGGQKGGQGDQGVKGEVGPRGCPGDSFVPPSFASTPQNLVFREIDPAVLVCNATANPYSRITWYRNNVKLGSSDEHYEVKEKVIMQSGSNESSCQIKHHPLTVSSLLIKQSRSSDTGNYICEARNIMGVFRYKIRLLVQVYVKFTWIPSNITVTENQDVQLSCRASGVPAPLITWYRKDGDVMPSRYRIIQGDLHLTRIAKGQEGSYVCVASNVLGAKSTEATITVNVFPVITYFQDQVTINEHQTLTLPCNATGYPAPTITWDKTNGSFPKGRYKFDSQMLVISDVLYEDRGEYVCTANNTVGTVLKKATAVVQVGPKIRRKPNDLENGYRGIPKVLYFEVFAFPEANITWKRLDNIKMSGRVRQEVGNLVIDRAKYTDGGFYQAKAKNILGEVRVKTFLVVKDPVSPWITSSEGSSKITLDEQSNLSRTCSAKGTPAPKLIWKFKNKVLNSVILQTNGSLKLRITRLTREQAGRYICEASNEFGSARQHFDLTVQLYVFVQSEGCDDRPSTRVGCGTCMIKVNNVEHCPRGRGHNIVVLNKYGNYQKNNVFDTHDDSGAGRKMKTFLDQLPNESIVIIAVQDSSVSRIVSPAAAALRSVGAVNPTAVSVRSTWLLVGYKGGSPSWITEKRADRYKGPSQANVKILVPVT